MVPFLLFYDNLRLKLWLADGLFGGLCTVIIPFPPTPLPPIMCAWSSCCFCCKAVMGEFLLMTGRFFFRLPLSPENLVKR